MSAPLLHSRVVRRGKVVPALATIRRQLIGRGRKFNRYYAALPLCGPSRASLLTGQLPHNNRMTTNAGTRGYEGWLARRSDRHTLPVWMNRAGYRTAHIGKYLNGYGKRDRRSVPPGWDRWVTPTHNNGALYYGAELNVDGRITPPQGSRDLPDRPWCRVDTVESPGSCTHTTDLFTAYAIQEINRGSRSGRPFYIQVDFNAPHDDGHDPAGPARTGRTSGLQVVPLKLDRRSTSLGRGAPGYLKKIPPITEELRQRIKTRWKNEVAALVAVDQGIARMISALRKSGELDNTYILFFSDNGMFHGQHRIAYGKYMPQEPATRQPLLVRGPGVKPGSSSTLSSTPDLTATILDLTGTRPQRARLDGISLRPELEGRQVRRRAIVLEAFAGRGLHDPRILRGIDSEPNDARRLTFNGFVAGRWKYIRYAFGGEEFYDILRDPDELNNMARLPRMKKKLRWARQANQQLMRCQGRACRPNSSLPPTRSRISFRDEERAALLAGLFWTDKNLGSLQAELYLAGMPD